MPSTDASGAPARRLPRTPIARNAAGIPDGSYTPTQGRKLRRGRSRLAPSPYWSDQTKALRTTMPPPADHTPMVECQSGDRQCGGRFYPFYYGVGCCCADCVNNRILKQKRAWEEFENGENKVVSDHEPLMDRGGHADGGDEEPPEVRERMQRHDAVIEQLRTIGLSDREIAVLSRSREGHSQREVARLCGVSKTWVCYLLSSSLSKITRAGLKLKEMPAFAAPESQPPRQIPTDPAVMDTYARTNAR